MIRGQRFELNLDDDDDDGDHQKSTSSGPLPGAFVADVLERVAPASAAAAPKMPTAPSMSARSQRTGFPEHSGSGSSRFRPRRDGATAVGTVATKSIPKAQRPPASPVPTPSPPAPESTSPSVLSSSTATWATEERARIDRENAATLAAMSPEQIEAERRELLESLSPAFLQRLLARADVSSGSAETDLTSSGKEEEEERRKRERREERRRVVGGVRFEGLEEGKGDGKEEGGEGEWEEGRIVETRQEARALRSPAVTKTEDINTTASAAVSTASADDDNAAPLPATGDTIHFPHPTQPPSLDPSSPSFLTDLHRKYFPSLPSDPSKLAWMQPLADTPDATSSYAPTAAALAASALRFDFRGALIPPSRAAEIPVTAGLHHHADAPGAAGYTVAELAHLARSTVPAQRCVAFQTLGRFLFRLGRGEFGNPSAESFEDEAEAGGRDVVVEDADEDGGDDGHVGGAKEGDEGAKVTAADLGELAQGLWREVDRCRVIPMLVDESEGRGVDGGRHVSAKAYATEAVWLWRKGGGRRWKAA